VNQQELEAMSDDEIDKKVFFARYFRQRYVGEPLEFCNSAFNAWPIIVENKIDIEFGGKDAKNNSASAFEWLGGDILKSWLSLNENPLRAAMIVFLLMKGES